MTLFKANATVAANGHQTPPIVRVGAPLPIRNKRPGFAALAVVLIVGLAALGAYFYSQAGRKVPVVVVRADVPAGHTITRADLSTVPVAGEVTAIGGSHLASVVGQTAAVELLPNTLLQRSMVTSAPALSSSEAQVGVAVVPGQVPADGLRPGDTVEVLRLPAKNTAGSSASTPATSVLAHAATVYDSTGDPSQSGGTVVTLVVSKPTAAAVAAASSAGLIALIRVGR